MKSHINAIFSLVECGIVRVGSTDHTPLYRAYEGYKELSGIQDVQFTSEDIYRLIDELDTLADTREEEEMKDAEQEHRDYQETAEYPHE